tara:strand:- start:291 stop:1316 length:1026 start_codon:yes stop_codon:yes gene_type:complete
MNYTFFDTFAGIGGFRLGLIQSGWKPVGWCEINKKSQETYRTNFDVENEFFVEDITKINIDELPDFDLLCGGFPCQTFSVLGKRKGFNDSRGTLIYHIFKILESKKPKVFILENVKGLVMEPFVKNEFRYIIKSLHDLGYVVFWKLLNSKNYNVPQNRVRVYIIGFIQSGFLSKEFVFPEKKILRNKLNDILENNVDNKYFLSKDKIKKLLEHKKDCEKKGLGFGVAPINPEINNVAHTILANSSTNIIMSFTNRLYQRNRFISPEGVSPTLCTNTIPTIHIESSLRVLTPRECARLQGFPEDFKIIDSDNQAYKQFGNAVTVNVVEAIGNKVKEYMYEGY